MYFADQRKNITGTRWVFYLFSGPQYAIDSIRTKIAWQPPLVETTSAASEVLPPRPPPSASPKMADFYYRIEIACVTAATAIGIIVNALLRKDVISYL